MSKKDEALKLALEALEEITDEVFSPYDNKLGEAITALREALEEQPAQRTWVGLTDEEQTQVAWSCGAMSADWLDFARAIEAKLKEKNNG